MKVFLDTHIIDYKLQSSAKLETAVMLSQTLNYKTKGCGKRIINLSKGQRK